MLIDASYIIYTLTTSLVDTSLFYIHYKLSNSFPRKPLDNFQLYISFDLTEKTANKANTHSPLWLNPAGLRGYPGMG